MHSVSACYSLSLISFSLVPKVRNGTIVIITVETTFKVHMTTVLIKDVDFILLQRLARKKNGGNSVCGCVRFCLC